MDRLSLLPGGGWVSADEAATHYISLIDNMEFGLNWLKDNVGEVCVSLQVSRIDKSPVVVMVLSQLSAGNLITAIHSLLSNQRTVR
jgi:hypothetical protein